MDLKEILTYNPINSDKRLQERAKNIAKNLEEKNQADGDFTEPVSKKPRQVLGSANLNSDAAATPGRNLPRRLAVGTPFISRNKVAQLDLVPPSMTPNSSKNQPQIYNQDGVEYIRNGDDSGGQFFDGENDPDTFVSQKMPNETQEEEDERLKSMLEKLENDLKKKDQTDLTPVIESEAEAKRLLTKLKKIFQKNQQLRIKHPDDPNKFFESEIELANILEHFRAFATVPEYYDLITLDLLSTVMIPCLSHADIDICGSMVVILMELTESADEKTIDEQEKNLEYLEKFCKRLLQPEFTG